jgi:hypothetical protein
MDWLILAGALALGILLGWMGCATFVQQREINAKLFGSIISVMGGGVAIVIPKALGGNWPREWWAYPIGLLVGFCLFGVKEYIEKNHERECDLIYNHIKNKVNLRTGQADFTMLTFDIIREDLSIKWSNKYFGKIIKRCSNRFTHARLQPGPGIRIL